MQKNDGRARIGGGRLPSGGGGSHPSPRGASRSTSASRRRAAPPVGGVEGRHDYGVGEDAGSGFGVQGGGGQKTEDPTPVEKPPQKKDRHAREHEGHDEAVRSELTLAPAEASALDMEPATGCPERDGVEDEEEKQRRQTDGVRPGSRQPGSCVQGGMWLRGVCAAAGLLRNLLELRVELAAHHRAIDAGQLEHRRRKPLLVFQQRGKQMFNVDGLVMRSQRGILRTPQGLLQFFGEPV